MSLGLLAWASLASPALAAENQAVNLPDTQTTKAPTVDAGSTLLKTILALTFKDIELANMIMTEMRNFVSVNQNFLQS